MDQNFLDRLMARGLISQGGFDRATERMMTHEAPQPNPAQPYIDATTQALRTGLGFAQGGLQGAGVLSGAPQWMQNNPVQRALQSPDNATAMGMAVGGPPFWIENPKLAAQIDNLIAEGAGQAEISRETGLARNSIQRYLAASKQKVASTDPWIDPADVEQLKSLARARVSHANIAKQLDKTQSVVQRKLRSLVDSGELSADELAQPQVPYFDESNLARQEQFKDLVRQNFSQRAIARKYYGNEGMQRNVSRRIKQFQERGELTDWVRAEGHGLTPAGRTPTTVQTKTQSREAPPVDRDYMKALQDYLRGQGLTSLAIPQYG